MEVILGSSSSFATAQSFAVCCYSRRNPTAFFSEVLLSNYWPVRKSGSRLCSYLKSKERNTAIGFSSQSPDRSNVYKNIPRSFWWLDKRFVLRCGFFGLNTKHVPRLRTVSISLQKALKRAERLNKSVPSLSLHLIVGVMIFMSLGATVIKTPSLALTEENLLFLEAWRAVDRAYVDKTFNGQSWFRYRENALRSEPMNTREETYAAIKKMLGTLDDPFTRFLEPKKFKSLRSGTRNTLTGVGLSIGYPKKDTSDSGLVVVSAAPGGPAYKAGVLSGDLILAINDTSTESMEIYDAAERLQVGKKIPHLVSDILNSIPGNHSTSPRGLNFYSATELDLRGPEGSKVELVVRRGSETRNLSLVREKVILNPVKSHVCRPAGLGEDGPLVGYIKLTSFSQNASGAVREAIETLRGNNVNSFILDLRDNSGGLFPEGVEIAKIWLNKGVIVYICDSRGVRDIYEVDGSNAAAASEPLVVLVNKGTASASEILAGALKDNNRAVLVGEPTYGKGKIQSVFELSDGSGLAVTVARYETPAHTDIDKVGIIPDRSLPVSFPKDEDSFCGCLQDPASACYLNKVELFSR